MRIDSFASTFCSAFQHEVISDNLTVIRPFNLFFSLCYTINLSKYNWRHWQHFYIAMRKIVIIRRMNRAYDDFSLLDIFWTRRNSLKKSISLNRIQLVHFAKSSVFHSTHLWYLRSFHGYIYQPLWDWGNFGSIHRNLKGGRLTRNFPVLKNSRTYNCFIKHFLELSFSNPKTWETPAHRLAFCVLKHLQCFILLN